MFAQIPGSLWPVSQPVALGSTPAGVAQLLNGVEAISPKKERAVSFKTFQLLRHGNLAPCDGSTKIAKYFAHLTLKSAT